MYLQHSSSPSPHQKEDPQTGAEKLETNLQFYYMSRQSMSDVVIFKNFDSDPDVAATFAPHASFRHPGLKGGDENVQPRESVEVRALVFNYARDE